MLSERWVWDLELTDRFRLPAQLGLWFLAFACALGARRTIALWIHTRPSGVAPAETLLQLLQIRSVVLHSLCHLPDSSCVCTVLVFGSCCYCIRRTSPVGILVCRYRWAYLTQAWLRGVMALLITIIPSAVLTVIWSIYVEVPSGKGCHHLKRS